MRLNLKDMKVEVMKMERQVQTTLRPVQIDTSTQSSELALGISSSQNQSSRPEKLDRESPLQRARGSWSGS